MDSQVDNTSVNLAMENSVWMMQVDNNSWKVPKQYDPIVVPKGHQDKVTFNVLTPGITFATKQSNPTLPSNPFCAQVGTSGKPTKCVGPFFPYDDPSTSPPRLVILDRNSDPAQLNYVFVLNFNNGVKQLDPIFNNGGNGRTGGMTSTSTLLIAAVVILALIIGLIFAFRGGKPSGGPSAN